MKLLNLNQSVYDATRKYPESINIIADLGFTQVRNGFLLRTLGRRYTVNEAISKSGYEREYIIELLKSKDFQIEE